MILSEKSATLRDHALDERLGADLIVDKLAQDYSRFFPIESNRWEYKPTLAFGHFQDAIKPPSAFDIVVQILWWHSALPCQRKPPVWLTPPLPLRSI